MKRYSYDPDWETHDEHVNGEWVKAEDALEEMQKLQDELTALKESQAQEDYDRL